MLLTVFIPLKVSTAIAGPHLYLLLRLDQMSIGIRMPQPYHTDISYTREYIGWLYEKSVPIA